MNSASNESPEELQWQEAYKPGTEVGGIDGQSDASKPTPVDEPTLHLPFYQSDKYVLLGGVAFAFVAKFISTWFIYGSGEGLLWFRNFPNGLFFFIIDACNALVVGLAIVMPYFFWRSKRHFDKLFVHPGYWIVAIVGMRLLQAEFQLANEVCQLLNLQTPETVNFWLEFTRGAEWFVIGLVCVLALFATLMTTGVWRFFFLLLVIPEFVLIRWITEYFIEVKPSGIAFSSATLAIGILMLICIDSERAKTVRRDWWHKCGLTMGIAGLLLSQVAWILVFYF